MSNPVEQKAGESGELERLSKLAEIPRDPAKLSDEVIEAGCMAA